MSGERMTGKSVYLGDGVWWRVSEKVSRRFPAIWRLPTKYDEETRHD